MSLRGGTTRSIGIILLISPILLTFPAAYAGQSVRSDSHHYFINCIALRILSSDTTYAAILRLIVYLFAV